MCLELFLADENEITAALDELRIMEGKKGFTVKQMENEKANLETKLDALIKEEKYDTNVFFEDMGFDRMFIDEAHYFKNKQFVTKMGRSVAGINASSVSQRATDLEMKIRYSKDLLKKMVIAWDPDFTKVTKAEGLKG